MFSYYLREGYKVLLHFLSLLHLFLEVIFGLRFILSHFKKSFVIKNDISRNTLFDAKSRRSSLSFCSKPVSDINAVSLGVIFGFALGAFRVTSLHSKIFSSFKINLPVFVISMRQISRNLFYSFCRNKMPYE